MSNNNNSGEKKNTIANLRRSWAKSDIQRLADLSMEKLGGLIDEKDIENKLDAMEKSKAEERARLGRRKGRNDSESRVQDSNKAVYEAAAASKRAKKQGHRKVSFIRRFFRLAKGWGEINGELKTRDYVTDEQRGKLRDSLLWSTMKPECQAVSDLAVNTWDFISDFGNDAWNIILFICDVIIRIGFYLQSLLLFFGDVLWDIRFFLEQHKHKLFLWFSSVISVAALIAITVSSVSAFEYSYHGRKLGMAKSKEEVFRTIQVLGDKLSEASGANVNLDVERDMEFTRVFGFKLDVDSADDILNTMTYMKDLQADAFAIQIDGKTAVVLESEDAANTLINTYRDVFAGERTGVEYSTIKFMEPVTVEPVQVLLGDIWNEDDALNYLKTGSTKPLEEDEEAKPIINIYSVETATYEEEVDYDVEYIQNTSLYLDETELFTAGVPGKDIVVAEIVRYNGVEQERKLLSSTRVSNPINAVYYQGTKPLPESIGTGSFIFPLQCPYVLTTYFHEVYNIPGVDPVHQGIDLACPTGNRIYATDGGVVTFAGWGGYGLMVQINHGGLYESIYGHCSEVFVHTGDIIYQGKHIANVGSTGYSTGPHLHFEVRYKGVPIDPFSVLQ